MGLRGPLPKTRAERKLTGNSGHRPLPSVHDVAPTATPIELECPEWLTDDAKAYWAKIVPVLTADSTVTERDWSALVNLCEAWGEFQDAARVLKKEGRYYETPNGARCVHPAMKVKSSAQKMVNHFMERFGEGVRRMVLRLTENRRPVAGKIGGTVRVGRKPALARLPWQYGRQIRRGY